MESLERFERYKSAKDAGCDWCIITSSEANKIAVRVDAKLKKGHGSGTHHKYDAAIWPANLMAEVVVKLMELGLPPATTELVAEVTINPGDRITTVPSVKTFTVNMASGAEETRYLVVVKNAHDMKEVLRHMRKADEANRATAARFFFRLKAAA